MTLDMTPDRSLRIGIDLGGTKIEIVALDVDGTQLLRRRAATPKGDYRGTLDVIAALVHEAENELGRQGSIGLGIPGAESAVTGKIKNANSIWLNGQLLRLDLQRVLQREIRLENDANCLALSEAVDGAGHDAQIVFAAIIGTGVGGGIVAHGRLLTGANHISGEWGHTPLPYPEEETLPPPRCYCGRQGCIETWLSGPGLSADHALHANGERLDAPTIVERAGVGDAVCEATMGRFERRLAKSLAQIINVLDPDVIVLGGGLSNLDRLYTNVPGLWGQYVFSDAVRTRLRRSVHGDSSGVRGAAWLWNAPDYTDTHLHHPR